MPHAFHTGLARPQRSIIRDAIAARLAVLRRSATPPGYLAALRFMPRTLRGEGDDDGLAELHDVVAGAYPAVAIALGRKTAEAGGDPLEGRAELEVSIYVVSAHGRGNVEGRLASDGIAALTLTADPGIEVMLEHLEQLLIGADLGVAGIAELRPVDEDEVATFENVTIWEQRYRLKLERVIDPLRAETRVITSIEARTELDGIPDGEPGLDPLITTITTLSTP